MRFSRLLLLVLLLLPAGCGRFAARRMLQAPNTYPKWLAPKAPVTIDFSETLLTAFTNHYLYVPFPEALIHYKIIEPADYQFSWTNHLDEGKGELAFGFSAQVNNLEVHTNRWTANPRGTVVLLHGYGVSGFAMAHWAFLLGEKGWRSVLVDLRGHGLSSGKQIYFGTQEVDDLRALLDQLQRENRVQAPVSVIGDSFGAVLALRWKVIDSRVVNVVAMSPYADLSKAILNVARQYAAWLPDYVLKAGLREVSAQLHVNPSELNPASWISEMEENKQSALFIAGGADKIAPLDQVELLYKLADGNSQLLVIPNAAHEPLPFYMDELADPITRWLSGNGSAK